MVVGLTTALMQSVPIFTNVVSSNSTHGEVYSMQYSLIHIYFAFIRPVLEYGDVVWGNCTKKESDLLESVQIEAGRIITGLRCNSSRQKLYHELG